MAATSVLGSVQSRSCFLGSRLQEKPGQKTYPGQMAVLVTATSKGIGPARMMKLSQPMSKTLSQPMTKRLSHPMSDKEADRGQRTIARSRADDNMGGGQGSKGPFGMDFWEHAQLLGPFFAMLALAYVWWVMIKYTR